jgi:hypothetical protein
VVSHTCAALRDDLEEKWWVELEAREGQSVAGGCGAGVVLNTPVGVGQTYAVHELEQKETPCCFLLYTHTHTHTHIHTYIHTRIYIYIYIIIIIIIYYYL